MTLFKYTPGLIEPETLHKIFMGRKEEIKTINRILRNASSGQSLSHAIIIGPKGSGKTHILYIIYHTVKGDIKTEGLNNFKEYFIPVISPEEEYIDSLEKFIFLIFKYLAKSEVEGIPPIPKEIQEPIFFEDLEKEIALSYIKLFKNKTGKILLLLIDNLNDIIENFSEEDQSSLRNILMTYDSVLLIGSAPTLFDSILDHDKPFYNFFEPIWLTDLTFEETKKLLEKYAEIEDRAEVIELLNRSEPKLRAIYELAGGNPRLTLSLYQIIAKDDISSVEISFLRMLDELVPYFRERMKDIPKQQQQIIDVMARDTKLLTPTEIASKCRLPVNVVNTQIKRLEKAGYLVKARQKRAKRVLYEMREKLFSIWRQMRVDAGKKRLGFLVRFYEIWYTKEELVTQLSKILSDIKEMAPQGETEISPLMDKYWYIKEALGVHEILCRLDADLAYYKKDYDSAVTSLVIHLKDNTDDYKAWSNLGIAYSKLQRHEDAIAALREAIKIKPDFHVAWFNLGYTYSMLKKHDEAISAYKKAIEIKSDYHQAWGNLGNVFFELEKYDEAISAYKKAIEIKSDYYQAWYNLGNAYARLKKYDEAIAAYQKAIEIKSDGYHAWGNLGNIYSRLEKYDEAIAAYQKALEIQPDDHATWLGLMIQYIFLIHDYSIKGDQTTSLSYLKSSLECISHITEHQIIFDLFASLLKNLLKEKKIALIKTTLNEIENAGQKELLEFLSPYSAFIKYLDTKDSEIIDRLRREEKVLVEDMLNVFEGKSDQKIEQGKVNNKESNHQ
jgi:hypothetical protein